MLDNTQKKQQLISIEKYRHYVDKNWPAWFFICVLPILFYPSLLEPTTILSGHNHLFQFETFEISNVVEPKNPLHSDPALLLYPLQKRVIKSLSNGHPPLWNPDIYGGAPLLADGQSKVFAPSTWLSLAQPYATAIEIEQWLILFWFSLGLYLLLRTEKISRFSACVGTSCALSMPFLHIWLHHPIALATCWGPWVLLGIRHNNIVICAVSTLGVLLAGHPATTVHIGIIALTFYLYHRKTHVLVGVLIGILCASVLWLPQLSAILESETIAARGGNRLALLTLIDIFWPQALGHPSTNDFRGPNEWASSQLHLGWPCILLCLQAIQTPTVQRKSILIIVPAIICLLLSLTGLPGPINHTRLAGIGILLFSGVAALGAQSITSGKIKVFTLTLIIGLGIWTNRLHQDVISIEDHQPALANWVHKLTHDLNCDTSADSCGRIIGLNNALIPNTASLGKIRDLRGYDLPVSKQTRRLMAALQTPPLSPWFPISETPSESLLLFATVRAIVKDSKNIYWIDKLAPRAWHTTCATKTQSPEQALREITLKDRRDCPPVEGLQTALRGVNQLTPISVSEISPEQIVLDISDVESGLIVLSDAYSSDWMAFVDNKETKIYRAGGFARAVLVPDNAQALELKYQPWAWYWGKRVSICGFLALMLAFIYSRKR